LETPPVWGTIREAWPRALRLGPSLQGNLSSTAARGGEVSADTVVSKFRTSSFFFSCSGVSTYSCCAPVFFLCVRVEHANHQALFNQTFFLSLLLFFLCLPNHAFVVSAGFPTSSVHPEGNIPWRDDFLNTQPPSPWKTNMIGFSDPSRTKPSPVPPEFSGPLLPLKMVAAPLRQCEHPNRAFLSNRTSHGFPPSRDRRLRRTPSGLSPFLLPSPFTPTRSGTFLVFWFPLSDAWKVSPFLKHPFLTRSRPFNGLTLTFGMRLCPVLGRLLRHPFFLSRCFRGEA